MENIKCCPDCGKPVIWTFIIPSSEWFCWICKWSGGMLYAKSKNYTDHRKKLHDQYEKEFDEASKDYIPRRCGLTSCKKCKENSNGYHWDHMSDEEKEKSNKAYEFIMNKHK